MGCVSALAPGGDSGRSESICSYGTDSFITNLLTREGDLSDQQPSATPCGLQRAVKQSETSGLGLGSVPPSVILTCADVGGVGGVAAVVLLLQEVLEDLATVQSVIAGFPVGTVRATC